MELRLENLVKDFSGTAAVNHVNLTIRDGKLTGLLGPSGCGKSTLLYMISGLEKVSSGRIFFGDRDVTDLPPEARKIGLVFQNYALYPHMTVEQNIMFPLENARVKKSAARDKALEMAKFVRIEEFMKRKPAQLSGGQQQRVSIARALVKSPEVILLDEPLSNLDARLRLELREEIRRIQLETGVTTIFVTHDQEEAMSITDELVLMKKGVVQQVAEPQDMYTRPANQFVASFLGNPPMNFFDVSVAEGRLKLDGEGGHSVCFDAPVTGDVVLGIRPEAWAFGEGVSVKAANVEVRGREQYVSFPFAGRKARAILDTVRPVRPGDALELKLKPHAIHLFDRESGACLCRGKGAQDG